LNNLSFIIKIVLKIIYGTINNTENLNDKVDYITSSSKGNGYGVAKVLQEQGMRVSITIRTKEAVSSLSKDATKILALYSNVSSMAKETSVVKTTIDHFG